MICQDHTIAMTETHAMHSSSNFAPKQQYYVLAVLVYSQLYLTFYAWYDGRHFST